MKGHTYTKRKPGETPLFPGLNSIYCAHMASLMDPCQYALGRIRNGAPLLRKLNRCRPRGMVHSRLLVLRRAEINRTGKQVPHV